MNTLPFHVHVLDIFYFSAFQKSVITFLCLLMKIGVGTGRELRSFLLALYIKSLERLLSKRTITGRTQSFLPMGSLRVSATSLAATFTLR